MFGKISKIDLTFYGLFGLGLLFLYVAIVAVS